MDPPEPAPLDHLLVLSGELYPNGCKKMNGPTLRCSHSHEPSARVEQPVPGAPAGMPAIGMVSVDNPVNRPIDCVLRRQPDHCDGFFERPGSRDPSPGPLLHQNRIEEIHEAPPLLLNPGKRLRPDIVRWNL